MKKFYTLDGEIIRYSFFDIIQGKIFLLGAGAEARVYLEGCRVVKIYRPKERVDRLDLDTAIKLRMIQTNRCIFPGNDDDSLLFDRDGNLVAYKATYIENLGVKDLLEQDISYFREEAKILRDDIKKLSEHKVRTDDFHFYNFSFNKGVYFIDPGAFRFMCDNTELELYEDNMFRVNLGLLYHIIWGAKYYLTHSKNEAEVTAMNVYNRYSNSGCPDAVEFISSEIKEKTLAKYLTKY